MKKILLLLVAVTVCSLGFTGCATIIPVKKHDINAVNIEPWLFAMPITADLNVSETQTKGEAKGKLGDGDRLLREATARALGQDPPRIEGPDLLVGKNVFTEINGQVLKVTVTGYPAWYANFRSEKEAGDSVWLLIRGENGVTPSYGYRSGPHMGRLPPATKATSGPGFLDNNLAPDARKSPWQQLMK